MNPFYFGDFIQISLLIILIFFAREIVDYLKSILLSRELKMRMEQTEYKHEMDHMILQINSRISQNEEKMNGFISQTSSEIRDLTIVIEQQSDEIVDHTIMINQQSDEVVNLAKDVGILQEFPCYIQDFSTNGNIDLTSNQIKISYNNDHWYICDHVTNSIESDMLQFPNLKNITFCYDIPIHQIVLDKIFQEINKTNIILDSLFITGEYFDVNIKNALLTCVNYKLLEIQNSISASDLSDIVLHCHDNNIKYNKRQK